MIKLLKRVTETAVKLPVAAAWDCISLGNMGEGSSVAKVLREHESKKRMDDVVDLAEAVKKVERA